MHALQCIPAAKCTQFIEPLIKDRVECPFRQFEPPRKGQLSHKNSCPKVYIFDVSIAYSTVPGILSLMVNII